MDILHTAADVATSFGLPIALIGGFLAYSQYVQQNRYRVERDFELSLPNYLNERKLLWLTRLAVDVVKDEDIDRFIASAQSVLLFSKYVIEYSELSKSPIDVPLARLATDLQFINLTAAMYYETTRGVGVKRQCKEHLPTLRQMVAASSLAAETKARLTAHIAAVEEKGNAAESLSEEQSAEIQFSIQHLEEELMGAIGAPFSKMLNASGSADVYFDRIIPIMQRNHSLQQLLVDSQIMGGKIAKIANAQLKRVMAMIPAKPGS